MFPSKLLLGKDMFTVTLVDLNMKTEFLFLGIWNDDRTEMIVFAFISGRCTIKFTENKWKLYY